MTETTTTTEQPGQVTEPVPSPAPSERDLSGGEQLGTRWRRVTSSLRTRVLLWYVVLLALALTLSILVVRQLLRVSVEERIDGALAQDVQELRRLAGGNDPETGEPFGARIERIFDVYRSRNVQLENEAVVMFVNGEYYAASRPGLAFDRETLDRWSTLETSQRGQVATPDGLVDYLAVPLFAGEGNASGVYVAAVFGDLERREVREVVQILAVVSFATLVFASGLAWVAAGRALGPVRLVTDTARQISDHNLTDRIPVRGQDEISQLAETFNRMLDRLEAAFASQREFVDDAGHELRTPITIIRGHLELLGDDPDERRDTVGLVIDELDRMHRIVNDLLVLAKARQPDFLRLDVVDLGGLTNEVYAKVTTLAARDWRLEDRGLGTIVADEQRLTQAMLQLAQNATQHTDEGDEIALGSELQGRLAHLWVRDTGPGVPLEDQARIFERFSRATGTRRRSEGAGLGLSIVHAIAEAHGGTVEVDSRPPDGATFTLSLPVGTTGDPVGEATPWRAS